MDRTPPAITRDFARKLEEVIVRRSELSFQLAKRDLGASVTKFGRTTAFMLARLPHLPWYTRVTGLSEADLDYLEDILALYKNHSAPCRFEIWPCDFADKLAHTLSKRGFTPSHQTVTLYRYPSRDTFVFENIDVTEAVSETDKDLAFEVMKQGYNFEKDQSKMLEFELQIAQQHVYIARVNNQPAAVATLFVSDNIAYLSGAATLPEYRSRGCQSALIQYRLQEAQNCEAVVVTTAYASPSQHNLERMGFRVLHTKQTWTQL